MQKDIFKYRKLSLLFLTLSIIFMMFGGVNLIFVLIAVIFFFLYVSLSFDHWRCPNCNKAFELRYSKMDKMNICPYCGFKLRN